MKTYFTFCKIEKKFKLEFKIFTPTTTTPPALLCAYLPCRPTTLTPRASWGSAPSKSFPIFGGCHPMSSLATWPWERPQASFPEHWEVKMKWKTVSKADFGLMILFHGNKLILLSICKCQRCALERIFGFNLRGFFFYVFPPSVIFPVELNYTSFVVSSKVVWQENIKLCF